MKLNELEIIFKNSKNNFNGFTTKLHRINS